MYVSEKVKATNSQPFHSIIRIKQDHSCNEMKILGISTNHLILPDQFDSYFWPNSNHLQSKCWRVHFWQLYFCNFAQMKPKANIFGPKLGIELCQNHWGVMNFTKLFLTSILSLTCCMNSWMESTQKSIKTIMKKLVSLTKYFVKLGNFLRLLFFTKIRQISKHCTIV